MPSLLSLLRLTAVTLCFGSLAACTTTNGSALVDSQVSVEISGQAARAIADDMVSQLADRVGPGTTTIALKGDNEPFGPALEASLRTKGYAVLTGQITDDASAVPLAYVIDPFASGAEAEEARRRSGIVNPEDTGPFAALKGLNLKE